MEATVAAISLAGIAVGGLVWVVKFFATKLVTALENQTDASINQAAASKKQAEASHEVLEFMKRLNGKLEKAYVDKVKEVGAE